MTRTKTYDGFTTAERDAMKERAKELKSAGTTVALEGELLAKIAEMNDSDRAIGEKIHAIVKANAPQLTSRLWYGMPAYAKDGKVVCFFQPAAKFKSRFAMLGFSDEAVLDDGNVWPTYYAVKQLSPADEKKVAAIVKVAVG